MMRTSSKTGTDNYKTKTLGENYCEKVKDKPSETIMKVKEEAGTPRLNY